MIRLSTALCVESAHTLNGIFPFVRHFRSRPKQVVNDESLPQLSQEEKIRIDKGIRDLQQSRRKTIHQTKFKPEETVIPQQNMDQKPAASNPPKQRKNILNDVQIDPQNLSERDFQRLQNMKENAPSAADVKKKNIASLMKDMNLSSSDQDFLMSNLNQANSSDPIAKMERFLAQDDSIMPMLESWQKQVEAALGKSADNPLALTKEDIAKIPPAPEKLQEMIKFIFSNDK